MTTMLRDDSDQTGVLDVMPEPERVVGRAVGERPGPTVIVMTTMHGNEPTGLIAARRVLQRIEDDGIELRGELVALAGNLPALREGIRYIDDDLNRLLGVDSRREAVVHLTMVGPGD